MTDDRREWDMRCEGAAVVPFLAITGPIGGEQLSVERQPVRPTTARVRRAANTMIAVSGPGGAPLHLSYHCWRSLSDGTGLPACQPARATQLSDDLARPPELP